MNIVSSSPDLFLSATTPVGMAHFVIIEDSVAPLKRCLRHDGAVCGVVLWLLVGQWVHWPFGSVLLSGCVYAERTVVLGPSFLVIATSTTIQATH